MVTRVAAVVGVGPGTGLAVAKRFAEGGYHVAMMARDKTKLEELAKGLPGATTPIECDASSEASVAAAFAAARAIGPVEVLVYNASGGFRYPPPKFMDVSLALLQESLQMNCAAAFLCAQQVVPAMVEAAKGTIIFTGATASLKGSAGFSQFAAGKFALRALAQSLARELHPQGVHVAHVIIDGVIATPRVRTMMPNKPLETMIDPAGIAEAYWALHSQPKSAWSQEIDLRPHVEKF